MSLGAELAGQRGKGDGPIWLVEGEGTVAKSPDGKLQLTVPKSQGPAFPWLTLEGPASDEKEQKWALQRRGCYVLWRPDSKAFAVTDPAYANHYFIRLFSTEFQLEGPVLGSPVVDLSAPVEQAFERFATKYYALRKYSLLLFYPKVLRWVANKQLLIGLDARTVEETKLEGAVPAREWHRGYVIETEKSQIVREMDEGVMLTEFRIDLAKQTW
jgi:hypothetical protein